MVRKCLVIFSFLFLMLSAFAFAQDDDLQSTVDYKVHKMKIELSLSEFQADAIRPIVKDYLVKRSAILEEVSGEGIVDHTAVKGTLKSLKENEYEKLAKILSEDQMKEWINKENLMASLNPDSVESTVDDGASFTPAGASLKF